MTATPTANHASSILEKLLEHRFVAELATALWLDGVSDFDILRSEVDAHGHDLVIEACGILRHIQLKTMTASGSTRRVPINVRLADRPSGCIVWMVHDPRTLGLGPFYWFGDCAGQPLPDLGARVARHSKANALGQKAPRPGHRVLNRGQFDKIDTIGEIAALLFNPGTR